MKFMFCPILKVLRHSKVSRSNYSYQRFIFTVSDVNEFVPKIGEQLTENVIKEKLSSLSVPFTDGFTCLHLNNCNLCSKKKSKKDSPALYLNKRTGFFFCEECKFSGNWGAFVQCLEKTHGKTTNNKNIVLPEFMKSTKTVEENLKNWQNIVNDSAPLCDLDNPKYIEVLKRFNLKFCEKSVIKNLEARISKDCSVLYFPLFSNHSIMGYKIFSNDGKSSTFPNTECPGIISTSKKLKKAVMVAEIQDFFALASQNLDFQILCLPYGVSVLPQSCLPLLEQYDKIILWLGGIEALDATFNIANKLEKKRCFIVKPVNNQKSAQYAMSKNENILNILLNSKPTWHESILTFSSLRDEVLAQLQNKDQCAGVTWKRFPVLNQILKGHRRGELTILTGPTGSGKTTFMSEYSLDLASQGVNTLWGSFEIKNSYLAKKMLQQYARLPLENHIDKFNKLADEFELLPIFFMSFHGQHKLSTVMEAVEHCSYVYDIAHVIIDNVQFMIEIEPENSRFDRFYKQDLLIQKFRKFATEHNCHVTLVMHPKKGMHENELSVNSIFGGVKATQEADNVLIIQNKTFNSFAPRKVLQIEKNRFSGDLGKMNLHFDKSTSCFSENSKYKNFRNNLYEVEFQKNQNDQENYESEREEEEEDEKNYFENYDEIKPQRINH